MNISSAEARAKTALENKLGHGLFFGPEANRGQKQSKSLQRGVCVE